MRAIRFKIILVVLATLGIYITGCKKDNSSTPTAAFTSQQELQVQNADVQDAIAEKTDQDIDKSVDQLQASNYQVSGFKAYAVSGNLSITVNHPDSTTFPKVITFVYTNYQDSTADESFVKNGEVDITINADPTDKQLVSWEMTFKQFSVTTDSTTFTVNGTRIVQRTGHTFKFNGLQGLRVTATDNISANLSYAIVKIGATDTLKFTRVVSKLRNSILHFDNIGGIFWFNSRFRFNLSKDTVTLSGTVTGINEKGDAYSKTVSASSPLIITFYRGTPIISSGILDYTVTGTTPASYTITFKEDPAHPFKTLITVTNNTNNATFSFDRKFSRRIRRWW